MENNPSLWQAVVKCASLAEEAGLDIDDLVKMLDAGTTPADVVEVVVLKLTAATPVAGSSFQSGGKLSQRLSGQLHPTVRNLSKRDSQHATGIKAHCNVDDEWPHQACRMFCLRPTIGSRRRGGLTRATKTEDASRLRQAC
jgi:hypothetical protein